MRKTCFYCIAVYLIIIQMLCSSCQLTFPNSDKTKYISATGTIHYIKYNEDNSALYIGLSDLVPFFDDNMFKIEGKNLQVAQENHIDDLLKIGKKIEFTTIPEYMGDGFIYPIFGLSINGITVL